MYFIREEDQEISLVTDVGNGLVSINSWIPEDVDYADKLIEAEAYLAQPLSQTPTGTGRLWAVDGCPTGTVISIWDEMTHTELVTHSVVLEPNVPLDFADAGRYSIRVRNPAPSRETRTYFEVHHADLS